ncbi:hypothetical protein MMPV_007466 [Pyropia vietnamensis]
MFFIQPPPALGFSAATTLPLAAAGGASRRAALAAGVARRLRVQGGRPTRAAAAAAAAAAASATGESAAAAAAAGATAAAASATAATRPAGTAGVTNGASVRARPATRAAAAAEAAAAAAAAAAVAPPPTASRRARRANSAALPSVVATSEAVGTTPPTKRPRQTTRVSAAAAVAPPAMTEAAAAARSPKRARRSPRREGTLPASLPMTAGAAEAGEASGRAASALPSAPRPLAPPPPALSPTASRQLRLQAQWLVPPRTPLRPGSPAVVSVARALFGVQAQDVGAATLAFWHRTRRACGTPTTTRAALMGWLAHPGGGPPSGLVRLHGQRGTLHAYDAADWPTVAGAYAERLSVARLRSLTAAEKRVIAAQQAKLSASLDRGATVSSADLDGSPGYVTFMGIPLAGAGARVNVSGRTMLAPRSVLAPELPNVWAPPPTAVAVATAVRRYFGAFAPATEADVRYYLGLRAAESRAAVAALLQDGILACVTVGGAESNAPAAVTAAVAADPVATAADKALAVGPSYMLAEVAAAQSEAVAASPLCPPPPCRLLGRFDPLLLGHRDKAWLVPPAHKGVVWSRNADVAPVVLLHGRVVGTWKADVGSHRGGVEIKVATWRGGGVLPVDAAAIHGEAEALAAGFWELPLTACVID